MPDVTADILENTRTATITEKVRTFRVEIDTPLDGEKVITFHCERRVLIDGVPDSVKPQGPVVRKFNDVATQLVTVADPVTGQDVTVSIAGLAMAITDRFMTWYEEQVNGVPPA